MRLALGRRRPLRNGTLSLPGLHGPITLRRDRYDIAYIEAQDDAGAWFGLGYCQAQDRAFQLELRLRPGKLNALVRGRVGGLKELREM